MRPGVPFLLQHPAHFIALGMGSGLSRMAPGTVGTLWAWLAFLVLQLWLDAGQMGWLIAGSTLIGWWACTVTAQHLRVAILAQSSGTRWWPSGWCCGWRCQWGCGAS